VKAEQVKSLIQAKLTKSEGSTKRQLK